MFNAASGSKPRDVAVEPLGRCALVFPAQAQVDGQLGADLPVVLEEETAVDHLVEAIGAAVDACRRSG